jgi:hypothetical protein
VLSWTSWPEDRRQAALAAIDAEARKVRAAVCRASAGKALEVLARETLAGAVLEPRARC